MRSSIIAGFAAVFAIMIAAAGVAQDPVAVALPTGAVPEAKPASKAVGVVPPKIKVQPLSVTVQLTDEGTKFSGTLSGLDQWPMKTSFGETNVPLSAVAGIKFAEEGHPSTTIVLHNGDSVSGALDLNHVQIETSWGKAEIDSGHIKSMLFSPGLTWTTEPGLNGTRWKLVVDKETPRQATRPVASNPTTGGEVAATAPAAPAAPAPTANRPQTTPQPGFTQPRAAQPGFPQPGFGQPFGQPVRPGVVGGP